MAGPQFIHLEGYARNTSKQSKIEKTNIDGVIGEALREAGFHSHIEKPNAPEVKYGSLNDLAAIRDEIADKIENEKDPRGRKIRTDKNILLAGVTSFAKPIAAMADASPDEKQEFEVWKELTIDFLKSEFGDNLRCVLEHTDEEYPHLHFYVLDKNTVSHTMELHPGFAAKNKADKSSRKAKDQAYRDAMGQWQDKYHTEVASYCGLTRLGPKVQRLNRPEWKARKQEAKALAEVRKQIDQSYEELEAELDGLEQEKQIIDKKVKAKIAQGLQKIRGQYEKGITLLAETYEALQKDKSRILKQYPDARLTQSGNEQRAEALLDAYQEVKESTKPRKNKAFSP